MRVEISVPLTMPNLLARTDNPKHRLASNLRCVGKLADEHFLQAADIVEKLDYDGWTFKAYAHAVFAQHADVPTTSQAYIRLLAIGIDPHSVILHTTWDDWFEKD